jgi:hypothetical protein
VRNKSVTIFRVHAPASKLMQHTRVLNLNACGVVCACAPCHAIFRRGGQFAKNFPLCLVMDVSADTCRRYFIDPPLTTATTLVTAAIRVCFAAVLMGVMCVCVCACV